MRILKVELKSLQEHSKEIKANTLFGAFCTAVNGNEALLDEVTFSDFIQKNKAGAVAIDKRAMVDRDGHGDNVVWTDRVSWKDGYFLAATTLDDKKFNDILELMLVLGIGYNRSYGYGQFKIVSVTDVTEDYSKKTGETYHTLSDSIPDEKTEFTGKFELVCYDGISMDNKVKPLMYMVKAGAELKRDSFGIIGRNIVSDGVWTQGKAIVVGV